MIFKMSARMSSLPTKRFLPMMSTSEVGKGLNMEEFSLMSKGLADGKAGERRFGVTHLQAASPTSLDLHRTNISTKSQKAFSIMEVYSIQHVSHGVALVVVLLVLFTAGAEVVVCCGLRSCLGLTVTRGNVFKMDSLSPFFRSMGLSEDRVGGGGGGGEEISSGHPQ